MNDLIIIGNDEDDYDIISILNNPEMLDKIGKKYKKIIYDCDHNLDWLPFGVTHLEIMNVYFNHPLNNLPQSLIYLCIRGTKPIFAEGIFNQPLDNLPNNLQCLILENLQFYEYSLDNLPHNLEYLFIIISNYDYELNNLPHSIHTYYKLELNNDPCSAPYDVIDKWKLLETL